MVTGGTSGPVVDCRNGEDAMKGFEERGRSSWDRSSELSSQPEEAASGAELRALQAVDLSAPNYRYVKGEAARTRTAIASGSLAGVLLIVLAIFMLQLQNRTIRTYTPSIDGQSGPGSASSQASSFAVTATRSSSVLPAAVRVGRTPPDFTLKTLDGQTVKLSEMQGKPVWINFWATWCPPCRAEMPEMKQKYAQFKDSGLVILGVDVGESAEQVKSFTTSNKFGWTFLLDDTREVSAQYALGGIPTHIFVGRDGVIKAMQVGGIPATTMDRYVSIIIDK